MGVDASPAAGEAQTGAQREAGQQMIHALCVAGGIVVGVVMAVIFVVCVIYLDGGPRQWHL